MWRHGISLHPHVVKSERMGEEGEVTDREERVDEEGGKRVWRRWRVYEEELEEEFV